MYEPGFLYWLHFYMTKLKLIRLIWFAHFSEARISDSSNFDLVFSSFIPSLPSPLPFFFGTLWQMLNIYKFRQTNIANSHVPYIPLKQFWVSGHTHFINTLVPPFPYYLAEVSVGAQAFTDSNITQVHVLMFLLSASESSLKCGVLLTLLSAHQTGNRRGR